MTSSCLVRALILSWEVAYLFLSLNELGELLRTTVVLGNFINENPLFASGFCKILFIVQNLSQMSVLKNTCVF